MGFDRSLLISFLLMALLASASASASASSSSFISESVFNIHDSTSTARNLLQAKKGCPVNFEFLNYTIITSECKGPHYPADRCCSSFKDFACPYADMINDLTNDCASTMFSYINLYGRYPPGLFASECRDGKQGLECPADPPSSSFNTNNAITITITIHSSLMHLLFFLFLPRLF